MKKNCLNCIYFEADFVSANEGYDVVEEISCRKRGEEVEENLYRIDYVMRGKKCCELKPVKA